MGSGVSSNFGDGGGGDLLAATFLIGQAIAAITFPGMFRIYDFHSSKAPRIKQAQNSFAFFGMDEDSDEEDSRPKDPSEYEHLFHVQVGNDTVYLEDPVGSNECSWTPLHTCCMSFVTKDAGLALIDEYERLGASLETSTMAGPGTFNSQWTALHMACAYGVEPLVERLVKAGSNVNTQNSFGYTPILEACHRGYLNVVGMLLSSGKVDLAHIPDENLAANSPFVSSPPQSALGEAARSGFQKITQMILDHGCPKDLQNKLGWTALHEACFFNRIETVKTLLLAGCRGDIRSRSGALPYHLASLKMVRDMIADMGGPGSVPNGPSDVVDMVQVLRELTSMGTDGDDMSPAMGALQIEGSGSSAPTGKSDPNPKRLAEAKNSRPRVAAAAKEKEAGDEKQDLLHTGGVLGDLPSLVSPNKASPDKNTLMKHSKASIDGAGALLTHDGGRSKSGFRGAVAKKNDLPKDVPPEYVCELSHRIMSDPVKSVYGHMFESTAINRWVREQGHICPLTGAPLAETDLTADDALRDQIQKWVLERSQGPKDKSATEAPPAVADAAVKKPAVDNGNDEDLYDF